MGWLGESRRRAVQSFRRERLAQELDAEMRIHLEMAAAEQRESGVPAEDAACSARRQFGNLTWLKERSVEAWGWVAVEQVVRDLHHALRTLARRPAFVTITVASLGLGIGTALAVFIVPMPFGVPFQVNLSVDWRVLGASFLLAVGASMVISLAPSLQASRLNVTPTLKREASGALVVGCRLSLRGALAVAQHARLYLTDVFT